MNLNISGRWAIVCGASKGLGRACAEALAAENVNVVIVARSQGPLVLAAAEIREANNVEVIAVAADVTTVEGREKILAACPSPDILITNAAGPKAGDFRDFDRQDWINAIDANMLTPIELIKATVDGMIERGFGRIINITSGAVKAPIDALCLSNGARSGLTGFVAGLSRKTARHNVTINNLLPGPFETDRLEQTLNAAAKASGNTLEQAREARMTSNPSRRFGSPDEFGATCAFLCSSHSGFMTGQNILLDGGAFPGTF
jgi:3-oxoacyl-[acyl-carrier protein] reductase